jgi:hypothetical protein
MKNLLTAILLLFSFTVFGQETFRKAFKLKEAINLEGGAVINLKKEEQVKFKDLNQTEKDSIQKIYKLGETLNYTIERAIPPGKVQAYEKILIDSKFFENLKIKKVINVQQLPAKEGFVKFDEDKVWVNPNLSGDFTNKGLYYYELKNRQSMNLEFSETTVSALTIPIKYRFKKESQDILAESKDISEEFTTAVNVNLFVGKTFHGKTKFHYREKVGNITNTSKFTGGLLVGVSTVTLDRSNTSASNSPILDDSKITKGLSSLGIGGTYTFNKINFGLFYGWDFSIGDDSSKWNYNKRPWLGLAVGYSILPF